MSEILFGGREAIEQTPAMISLINVNSPLRYDDRMLSAMLEYNSANQAVVITPFILMGAMSPVSVPAALTQQIAEALAGIALAQLVRPGCPVVFGSFLSNTDMQSGSPSFGTPESAIGLLCTGQIGRHFGLPWRSGGGLTASQTVDAQAAYEAVMTMLPTFLAGANFVMHSAGWLESGLVSCYEKFIVDIEVLRMLQAEFAPLEVTDETIAFSARTRRSATAATSSARRTRSSASATASTGRCSRRPRTSSAGRARAAGHHGARRRDLAPDARGVRAAAAGRRDPRGARRVRHPPPRRARRLIESGVRATG